MKKVLIGTYLAFPIYVEVDDSFNYEEEKEMLNFFRDIGKARVEVNPELAKHCCMKTKTYYEGDE